MSAAKAIESDYGEKAERPDTMLEDFEEQKLKFLNSLPHSEQARHDIERETLHQIDSHKWREIRRKLLTASNFGPIIRIKSSTNCEKWVKKLLYEDIDCQAMQYGRMNENKALSALAEKTGENILPCGIFIHESHPYLGASPDGLIGNNGIVEVKCPYSARDLTPEDGILQEKIYFWVVNKDETKGKIKEIHKWYNQVQGQLNIAKKDFCIFAAWTPKGLIFEKIVRDEIFWETQMLPKLEIFYIRCLLPEIIDPRHTRSMLIRNPDRN